MSVDLTVVECTPSGRLPLRRTQSLRRLLLTMRRCLTDTGRSLRGLLVAVGRCDTQVRLSLIYVSGNLLRPLVPRIPLRMVLRSVTHKQDARIVDKVYWWMLQSSKLLSVFKPDTLSGVLTLFNDHNLSYSRTGPEDNFA